MESLLKKNRLDKFLLLQKYPHKSRNTPQKTNNREKILSNMPLKIVKLISGYIWKEKVLA